MSFVHRTHHAYNVVFPVIMRFVHRTHHADLLSLVLQKTVQLSVADLTLWVRTWSWKKLSLVSVQIGNMYSMYLLQSLGSGVCCR